MEKELPTVESLTLEAESFVRNLSPKESGATLVTLSGELGAGKTTFTQGIALALGVTETVTSPTFVLEKIYELPEDAWFSRLAHIDAYRLEGEANLLPLGFSELMEDKNTLIVLEWPEMVAGELPAVDIAITLEVLEEGRKIRYA